MMIGELVTTFSISSHHIRQQESTPGDSNCLIR